MDDTNQLGTVNPSEENPVSEMESAKSAQDVSAENTQEPETDAQDAKAESTPEERKAARKKKFWKEVREWIVSLAAALLIVFVIRFFLFTIIRVDGSSMEPTLHSGERLFVTVADVKFGNGVERGDVVICRYPNRGWTNFVKRVVAVPGDRIYRKDGVTHVIYSVTNNGITEVFDESLPGSGSRGDIEEYELDENEYFVVGDNRGNSHDSRSDDVGTITKDMIVGRVRNVIWPLSDTRSVE